MPRWTFIKILLTSTVIYKHFCVENEFVQYLQNYKYYNRVLINKEKTRVWQRTLQNLQTVWLSSSTITTYKVVNY